MWLAELSALMKHFEARNASALSEILNRVHDRFFDLEEIVFDETQKILWIPITVIGEESSVSRNMFLVKVHTHPICAANLIIHTVSRFEIVDQAETGQGNINTIGMDGDSVIIECGLPVTITAKVNEFHLTLNVSDQVLGYKRYYSLL